MPLIDHDSWPEESAVAIYIAGNLKEAQRVESALEGAGLDYSIQAEKYETAFSFIFGSYDGVAFHVLETDADRAVEALRKAGVKIRLVKEPDEASGG
jgi:hypothetical protein